MFITESNVSLLWVGIYDVFSLFFNINQC
jgi:hypothetical protein